MLPLLASCTCLLYGQGTPPHFPSALRNGGNGSDIAAPSGSRPTDDELTRSPLGRAMVAVRVRWRLVDTGGEQITGVICLVGLKRGMDSRLGARREAKEKGGIWSCQPPRRKGPVFLEVRGDGWVHITGVPVGRPRVIDVVIDRRAVVVSGRVRSSSGNPLRADLFIEFGDYATGLRADARGGFEVSARWPEIPERPADWTKPCWVHATVRGLNSASVTDIDRFTGLVLTLEKSAALIGRVLLPTGMRGFAVRPEFTHNGRRSPGGYFDELGVLRQSASMRSGRWSMTVRTHILNQEIIRLGRLDLAEGQVLRDPRLNPLDLRGVIHSVKLQAVDDDGKPVDHVHLYTRENREALSGDHNLRSLPIVRGQPLDVWVSAHGDYRYRNVTLHDRDVTVQLSKSDRATFIYEGPHEKGLRVFLMPHPSTGWPRHLSAVGDVEVTGRASVPVTFPGRCIVRLLHLRDGAETESYELAPAVVDLSRVPETPIRIQKRKL